MDFYAIADNLFFVSEKLYFVVAFFALYKAIKTKQYVNITVYLLIMGLVMFFSTKLANANLNNLPLYNFTGLFELIAVFLIYKKEGISKLWNFIVPVLAALFLYTSIFVFEFWSINSYALAGTQLIVILIGCNYSYKLILELKIKKLSKHPFYYFHIGFLLYAAGVFFISLMSSEIIALQTNNFFHNAWILECVFNVIRLSFITYGLILAKDE